MKHIWSKHRDYLLLTTKLHSHYTIRYTYLVIFVWSIEAYKIKDSTYATYSFSLSLVTYHHFIPARNKEKAPLNFVRLKTIYVPKIGVYNFNNILRMVENPLCTKKTRRKSCTFTWRALNSLQFRGNVGVCSSEWHFFYINAESHVSLSPAIRSFGI